MDGRRDEKSSEEGEGRKRKVSSFVELKRKEHELKAHPMVES